MGRCGQLHGGRPCQPGPCRDIERGRHGRPWHQLGAAGVTTPAPMAADLEPAGQARVPAGLQAAIERAFSAQPVTSPSGVTLSWGRDGTVWFSRSKGPAGRFELIPLSMGRSSPRVLSPGPFAFGPRRTNEALGDGLTAWYTTTSSGFEQGFTVSRRPPGKGGSFSINQFYSSSLDPAVVAPGRLSFSGPAGPVMAYGPLQAIDASGRLVPAQLSLAEGRLQIVVDDTGAAYPLDIDSAITASRTPVASFSGSPGTYFGLSVAISADGQEALVGAQFANSAYLFAETAGTWRTTPMATFRGGSGGFGSSVALSADGQEALVGAPFTSSNEAGAVYVYQESAGGWPARPVATLAGRSGDFLGSSVALSADGQEALVGAPAAGAGFRGAAYLYAESAGSWPATPIASFPSSSSSGEGLGFFRGAVGRRPGGAGRRPVRRVAGQRRLPLRRVGRFLAHHPYGELHRYCGQRPRFFGGAVGRRPGGAGGRPVRQRGERCRLPLHPVGRFLANGPGRDFHRQFGPKPRVLSGALGAGPGGPGGRPRCHPRRRHGQRLHRGGRPLAHKPGGRLQGRLGRGPRILGGAFSRWPGGPGGR